MNRADYGVIALHLHERAEVLLGFEPSPPRCKRKTTQNNDSSLSEIPYDVNTKGYHPDRLKPFDQPFEQHTSNTGQLDLRKLERT